MPEEILSPFHQYDDVPDIEAFDLALDFEYEPEDLDVNEPTAEQLLAKYPKALQDTRKMLRRMALISGHQSGYEGSPQIDRVDAQREAEKLVKSEYQKAINREFERRSGRWPDADRDQPKPQYRPVPSEARAAAELIGADPSLMCWPRHIDALPLKEKLVLLNRCFDAEWEKGVPLSRDQAVRWNRELAHTWPSTMGARRHDGTATICREPGAPEQPGLVGIAHHFKSQDAVPATTEWKRKAEQHELPDVITKCAMTGESLIKKRTVGQRSWRVGPNIHGMGLRGARLAVEAAAILSLPVDQIAAAYGVADEDIAGAKVEGDIPEFVHQLAKDGDAWAILASHTEHPVWSKTARFLLMLRDQLYFKLDEKELREGQRISQKIADELALAYPDQFVDNRAQIGSLT